MVERNSTRLYTRLRLLVVNLTSVLSDPLVNSPEAQSSDQLAVFTDTLQILMERKQKPYWYTLIKLLKANRKITTGLTIPYVFGAYEILEQPLENINHLVKVLLESVTDKFPVIQKCPEIGQHVIMLEDKEICNKYYKKDIRFENFNKKNLLFISANTELGKSIERLCWNLTAGYETQINSKDFSWNNKKKCWQKFEKGDIEMILSIK